MRENSSDANLWWQQAQADLETAEINWRNKRYYACSFFSQQAVEKALKAIIIAETKKMPPKIHRLYELSSVILTHEEIKEILEKIRKVDLAYLASRYPDMPAKKTAAETIDSQTAWDHYFDAKEVIEWLQKKFQIQS
ncbi:MAG: HEPN domain-containing protein [Candidatus Cloacimonetes bacterium]|nr:HEPN domain-containing protein [Candidatus Cloacimonadota bacterium]